MQQSWKLSKEAKIAIHTKQPQYYFHEFLK